MTMPRAVGAMKLGSVIDFCCYDKDSPVVCNVQRIAM